MSADYQRPLTEGQRTMLDTFFHKRREEQLKEFIASMVDPPPPPVNLSDPLERSCATAAGKGYVAGLAGSRTANPYAYPGLRDNHQSKAWRRGWEQGRNHRARSLELVPTGHFGRERLNAMLVRMELPPF